MEGVEGYLIAELSGKHLRLHPPEARDHKVDMRECPGDRGSGRHKGPPVFSGQLLEKLVAKHGNKQRETRVNSGKGV